MKTNFKTKTKLSELVHSKMCVEVEVVVVYMHTLWPGSSELEYQIDSACWRDHEWCQQPLAEL